MILHSIGSPSFNVAIISNLDGALSTQIEREFFFWVAIKLTLSSNYMSRYYRVLLLSVAFILISVFRNDDWCRCSFSYFFDSCFHFGPCCSSSQVQMFVTNEYFYYVFTAINDNWYMLYKLCSWWVNLRFPFETECNDSCGQFALIIVFNLELSVWTVWGDWYFYGRFMR